MYSWLDEALVGGVLVVSVLYAIYALGPRAWRPRMLAGGALLLRRLPAFLGLAAAAGRLEAAAIAKSAKGSCGGCDNCGSEATPTGSSSAAGSGAPSEVSVPLSKIGRRGGG